MKKFEAVLKLLDFLDTGLCNLIVADFPEVYAASNKAHWSIKFTGSYLSIKFQ
jgi:hypothetical protein